MASVMKIIYDGNEYISKDLVDKTASEMNDIISEEVASMNRLSMETEKGFFIIGSEAIQRAVILLEDI